MMMVRKNPTHCVRRLGERRCCPASCPKNPLRSRVLPSLSRGLLAADQRAVSPARRFKHRLVGPTQSDRRCFPGEAGPESRRAVATKPSPKRNDQLTVHRSTAGIDSQLRGAISVTPLLSGVSSDDRRPDFRPLSPALPSARIRQRSAPASRGWSVSSKDFSSSPERRFASASTRSST